MEKVDLDELVILLCDVLFGGVVEDDVIQDLEDEVDVVVDLKRWKFCSRTLAR